MIWLCNTWLMGVSFRNLYNELLTQPPLAQDYSWKSSVSPVSLIFLSCHPDFMEVTGLRECDLMFETALHIHMR